MELSSSIYLFLKSNIKGNKPRRSSDTVLCNSDLYKTERGILKEMRLTEKSSLIEEKQKSRRFKSAPNSRQKKDQSAVFSISTKEKSHEKSLIQYCKTCNSKRNDFKSNALPTYFNS
ncbi:hypothetical protein BpHYR1_009988 [Brachionus plicatilis]|uniref:Uncharacterized protein n=1 Tax=Brachionus plicatilis TaxID=10195 RepID=A0A3M7RGJ9_BRAPC|nr:hypothetical protein BpHYR1_009988 [Brachionus plicatilis]